MLYYRTFKMPKSKDLQKKKEKLSKLLKVAVSLIDIFEKLCRLYFTMIILITQIVYRERSILILRIWKMSMKQKRIQNPAKHLR